MGIQEGVEDAAAWVANTSRLLTGCWIATTPATGPSTESHTARNRQYGRLMTTQTAQTNVVAPWRAFPTGSGAEYRQAWGAAVQPVSVYNVNYPGEVTRVQFRVVK